VKLSRFVVLAVVASACVLALASCGKATHITSVTPGLDPAPPSAPASLTSTYAAGVGYDYLYWNASASPSVNGYEIWEAATPGGTAVKIASVKAASNYVVLPAVSADCTRYYTVRASNASGLVSAFSSALAVERHVIVSAQSGGGNGSGDGGGHRMGE
jgi:hypothetical protein